MNSTVKNKRKRNLFTTVENKRRGKQIKINKNKIKN